MLWTAVHHLAQRDADGALPLPSRLVAAGDLVLGMLFCYGAFATIRPGGLSDRFDLAVLLLRFSLVGSPWMRLALEDVRHRKSS
eukprot:scaffold143_cov260-Pinguiococcus_pyrenoidosus.AAC.50